MSDSRDITGFDTGKPFRVRAEDAEDLAVVSAYLQDAVMPIGEMIFEKDFSRFVMVLSRYRWEAVSDEAKSAGEVPGERVHCGVRIENAGAVRSRGLDPKNRADILNLLAIQASEGHVNLIFSGDRTIQIDVDGLSVHVEDLGEPWPTVFHPDHDA